MGWLVGCPGDEVVGTSFAGVNGSSVVGGSVVSGSVNSRVSVSVLDSSEDENSSSKRSFLDTEDFILLTCMAAVFRKRESTGK